jgi:transglutaminase-like putative cysteine protease
MPGNGIIIRKYIKTSFHPSGMALRYIAVVFMLLILMPGISAFDESLFSASFLEIQTDVRGRIDADYSPRSQLSELKVTYSLFPKDEYSTTYSIITTPKATGKDPLIFTWTDLRDNYEYYVRTTTRHDHIGSVVTKQAGFPQKETPHELLQYTKPSHFIDSDNRMIREIAHSIAEGETDILELQLKIADFVRNEIRYDITTLQAEAKLSASETLVAKEGVCREITLLFIAINRALNIPARYVSGYAYTNVLGPEGQWAGHAWAEVWIDGQWIPYDVTYGEYMHISPIHIPFSKTVGAQDSKTTFEWKASNVQIVPSSPEIDVRVTRHGRAISFGNMNAEPVVGSVGEGSYNLIKATIENPNPYAISPRIMIGRTQGLEIISNERTVLLYPYETREIYFIAKINDTLNKGYVYTFPIIVYAQGFDDARTEFTASSSARKYSMSYFEDFISEKPKTYFEDLKVSCDDNEYYPVGQDSYVHCTIINDGNVNYYSLSACIDSCDYFSLGIQEERDVRMALDARIGMNMAYVSILDNGRILSEERLSYEGIMPLIVNVSFDVDDSDWPSGKVIVSASSSLNGTLTIRTNTGYVQQFHLAGDNMEIPVSFPFNAHRSLDSSVETIVLFEDYLGRREESYEHDIKIRSTLLNSLRIFVGRVYSLFS